MADEQIDDLNKPGADAGQTVETSGTGGGTQDTAGDADEVSKLPKWAQDLIGGLRAESAENRTKASKAEKERVAREKAAKEAEEKRLVEQGEFKTLADQRAEEIEGLKAKASKADELLNRIAEGNKTRIAAIPEKLRSLVPAYHDPIELDKWLTDNAANLAAPAAPDLNGGQRGEGNASPGNFTLPTVNL